MKKLTPEQQKLIEESMWVVNTVLKAQGEQNNEDLRQDATLYMCKCAMRFDPSKHIKWGTFAYKNVFLFVRRERVKAYNQSIMESETEYIEALSPADLEMDFAVKNDVNKLKSVCNKDERIVLQMKLDGFTGNEMAHKMNCSKSKINNCISKIKEKAKELDL